MNPPFSSFLWKAERKHEKESSAPAGGYKHRAKSVGGGGVCTRNPAHVSIQNAQRISPSLALAFALVHSLDFFSHPVELHKNRNIAIIKQN